MDVWQWRVLPGPGGHSGRGGKWLAEWKMAVCKESVCTQLRLWQKTARPLLPLLHLPLPMIDLHFNFVNNTNPTCAMDSEQIFRPLFTQMKTCLEKEECKSQLVGQYFIIHCKYRDTLRVRLTVITASPLTCGLLIKHLCPWVTPPSFSPGLLYCIVGLTSESTQINISSKLLSLANLNFTSLLTHNPVRTFILYPVSASGGFSSQAIEINYSD